MILKGKLSCCRLTVGSWLMLGNTSVVEIMKHAGFEWLVVDMEHTPISLGQAKELISTIQANGMEALVRVSKNEEVIIKKVLDLGANGIIVPMICNEDDAENAINYSYYPPRGKRGVGLFRAQEYGIGFEKYKNDIDKEIVIIAQIEHIEGANNIESIIGVDGIDGVIIGPYDMSASMGYPGEFYRDDVQAAISRVFEKCIKAKKSVGFHVVEADQEKALARVREGGNLIAFSIDYIFLRDKVMDSMAGFRKGLE